VLRHVINKAVDEWRKRLHLCCVLRIIIESY